MLPAGILIAHSVADCFLHFRHNEQVRRLRFDEAAILCIQQGRRVASIWFSQEPGSSCGHFEGVNTEGLGRADAGAADVIPELFPAAIFALPDAYDSGSASLTSHRAVGNVSITGGMHNGDQLREVLRRCNLEYFHAAFVAENVTVEHVAGSLSDKLQLEDLPLQRATKILIMADNNTSRTQNEDELDNQTIAVILQVQDILTVQSGLGGDSCADGPPDPLILLIHTGVHHPPRVGSSNMDLHTVCITYLWYQEKT